MAREDPRVLHAESQLRWQTGDGAGAMWKAQQASEADRRLHDDERLADSADVAVGPVRLEYPVLDPVTGQSYRDVEDMVLARSIAADPSWLRRMWRRWINGIS